MKARNGLLNEKYKTQLCKGFHKSHYCSYGLKCNFIHNSYSEQNERVQFFYTILNNLKTINPKKINETIQEKRLPVFKAICKIKWESESDNYDIKSMSTVDERERSGDDNGLISPI